MKTKYQIMALSPVLLFSCMNGSYSSDLSIYQGNSSGQTSIFMMLDTSGSMGWGAGYGGSSMSLQDDYKVCIVNDKGNNGSKAVLSEDSTTTPSYKRYYCSVTKSIYDGLDNTYKQRVRNDCTVNGTGYKCYDRLTRLKDAMFTLLNSRALSGIKLGAGYYSYYSDEEKGQKGIVSIPAKPMSDPTHVTDLKNFVAGLKANGGTPTAAAYAEAGAYMMGTKTSGTTTENIPIYKDKYAYSPVLGWLECTKLGASTLISENGYAYKKCDSGGLGAQISEFAGNGWRETTNQTQQNLLNQGHIITRYSGFFDSAVYAEITDQQHPITNGTDSVYSGYSFMGKYISGSGNYSTTTTYTTYSTLTDIGNDSNYISPAVANSTCSGNGIYFLTDGYPNGTEPKAIRNLMNLTLKKSDGTNAISMANNCSSSLSSTGSSDRNNSAWECIGEYSKALMNKSNPQGVQIQTAVIGFGSSFAGIPKNADGTYNCNAPGLSKDIQNSCLWGTSDYGTGGFYQASNSEDIISSMTQFLSGLEVEFKPSNLGVISIPKDPLDQTKAMNTGFFPMLQPLQDSTRATWLGNLKKYYVYNGTLSDSETGGNTLYTSSQEINPLAKDLWSTTTGDNSPINIGGAWNKIPVPSSRLIANDAISNINSNRNVYVLSNGNVKKVTKDNLAEDIPDSDKIGTESYFSITTRKSLLKYLGYQAEPANLNKATLNAIAHPTDPYRFLGGVIHSKPLVVTKSSDINILNNKVTSRDEYVIYGSIEGGLHIVDAISGKEQSVFIPKEILVNQPETLASENAISENGIKYGVDAPWTADNTFKVTTVTSGAVTTAKYEADKMNIYGGLRMGGEALYGLNISTPSAPSLLFHNTPAKPGFSRMAQIWSKPTIANVRVKGEKKRVLIFGGGYDQSIYEKPASSYVEPTTSTRGNALYIVDASNGSLLWMTSADTSDITQSHKYTQNSDIRYSVVGQPTVLDYDADGLTDVIYFADLGGQIFRVDLNNANQISTKVDSNLAVRVQTIANLQTGSGSTLFVPRFYERLSVAVFDEGQERFVLLTAGSGNRSFPLEEEKAKNKVYGIIDRDVVSNTLATNYTPSAIIKYDDLAKSGVLGKTDTTQISSDNIASIKNKMLKGWAFELRSIDSGNYARAYEESDLKGNDLYVSLYDPKATATGGVANSCTGGVRGLSTIYRICMPYGECAAYLKKDYLGIVGPNFGPTSNDPRKQILVNPNPETKEMCVGNCNNNNTVPTEQKTYTYSQYRKIKPVRWFEW
ncbi:pilus assembly protein [Acinetobacter haemolyticus]|uniref:PilC/PilY family type IV pilus protein n=1 Tax=Acinetobacter haemolyticus TaxID=29430 RepID=UPI0013723729|nr:PilC/PilY family type IV pilus protein [Acinetobacter haemolyticus]NAR28280.1 pilus assembly protein [Acinetobacter haemolyticus]NAR77406.1 pilus assembly protein [Acinetobacter haemolyticus]